MVDVTRRGYIEATAVGDTTILAEETDPDKERMQLLIDEAKTLEDIEFARSMVTDETLIPLLDLKEIQIKKEISKK